MKSVIKASFSLFLKKGECPIFTLLMRKNWISAAIYIAFWCTRRTMLHKDAILGAWSRLGDLQEVRFCLHHPPLGAKAAQVSKRRIASNRQRDGTSGSQAFYTPHPLGQTCRLRFALVHIILTALREIVHGSLK
jgi:hypothetical protein